MSRSLSALCVARWLAVLLATVPTALAQSPAAEYPRLSRSLHWRPYVYDADTVALYHLDKAAPAAATMPTDAELFGEGDGAPVLAPPGGAANGPGAANAVPTGTPAALRGQAAFIPDGRLGGGLRLPDTRSALYLDGAVANTGSRTVEAWVRLTALPAAEGTLFYVEQPPPRDRGRHQAEEYNRFRQPAALAIKADGSLLLRWYGRELTVDGPPLVPGRWTHIACALTTEWPWGATVRLFVDGYPRPPFALSRQEIAVLANDSRELLVGNRPDLQAGLAADFDEIRLSRSVREYYPYDLTWPEPARDWPATGGQPFFREADDLLFQLGFNHSLKPGKAAAGTALPEQANATFDPELDAHLFADGVEGVGLLLGDKGLRPSYGAAGNLDPREGTIAFWMQPLDWDNLTRDNRFDQTNPTVFGLFQIIAEYVEGSHERIFSKTGPILQCNINLHLSESVDHPIDFTPGQWYHLTMTWIGADFTFYLNGRQRNPDGALNVNLELRTPDDPYPYKQLNPRWWTECRPLAIQFRERRYWEQSGLPVPRTALDDFRIYRRALAPSEIANLAAWHDPRTAAKALPDADLRLHWNGVSGKVKAKLIPLVADYASVAGATVAVTREGETEPVGSAELSFDASRRGEVTVTTPPLDFATYEVNATLRRQDGSVAGTVADRFTRTAPPWWGTTAGESDEPMPPWTPVETTATSIDVWGRSVQFAPSGLPAQVISAGEPILAGPVTAELAVDGEPVAWQDGKLTVKKCTNAVAEASGGLTSPRVNLTTTSSTEFDGMIWFELTLTPVAGQTPTIDRFALRLPYRPAAAELVHWWSGARNMRDPKHIYIGNLYPGEGEVFRSNDAERVTFPEELRGSFMPYVMLTGMARGMAWFAENDRGWTQTEGQPALTIARDAAGVVALELHVIAEPIVLDGPRTIAFGLHPIPVRPMETHWRMSPEYSNVFPDTFCGNNLKGRRGPSTFNTTIEDTWEDVRRRIDGEGLTKGAAGLKGLERGFLAGFPERWGRPPHPAELTVPGLYLDMQWTGRHPDHTREWTETWGLGHGDFQHYDAAFVDFSSWAWEQWITQTDGFVRGIYLDDCWGAPQRLLGGPVAYALPDGHVQPGYQFRGYRERMKRIRQICYDQGIEPRLTAHTTHTFFIPWHSFFDLILDGEDFYASPPEQATFLDRWRLDRMRFMHHGKWGLTTTWLGWHGNSLDTDKWPAWTYRHNRAYVASMALHDIMWKFDHQLIRSFGLREPDCVTVPYWDGQGLATHRYPDLLVTAWKRDGKCLLLLVNRGTERLDAEVTLAPAAMGFANLTVAQLIATDVDPDLLVYFDEDTTTMKTPGAADLGKAGDDLGIDLDEQPKDLPIEERRAKDPDGKLAWADGQLKLPIRPKDYRLILIAPRTAP